MPAESSKHLALSQLPLPARTGPNGRHGSLAISCPPPFPQMSGPVDLLSTPTQGAKVHAVRQSYDMDHGGPDQQRVSPTTAKHHHGQAPPRPGAHEWFAIQDHQPLPSRHRVDYPYRDATPRWTNQSCTNHFHFSHPARRRHSTLRNSTSSSQGDLLARAQHRSISACVLFLACVGSTRSPQIGERGPPTPFFLRQSCSGPSWRSLAGGPAKPLRSSCF